MNFQSRYNVIFLNSSGYIAMQFEDSKVHDLSQEYMEELMPMPQQISEWSVERAQLSKHFLSDNMKYSWKTAQLNDGHQSTYNAAEPPIVMREDNNKDTTWLMTIYSH